MRNSVLIAVLLLLPLVGCVGFGAATYGKYAAAKAEFGLHPERNSFSYSAQTYSPDDVIRLWGEPDSRDVRNACSVFGYKNGTSWSGGGVFVGVVPVPLVVPSGNYWNYIYFRDGETVGAVVEYGEVKGTAGVFCGSNDCETGVHEEQNAPGKPAEELVEEWCKAEG